MGKHLGIGIAIGAGIGVAMGNIGVGVAIGVAIGIALGAAATRSSHPREIARWNNVSSQASEAESWRRM